MNTVECTTCGAPTMFLRTYNGQREQFDREPVTNLLAPDSVRWYVSHQRGAVPATVVARPAAEPFLMRHTCRLTRHGTGDSRLEPFAVAQSDSPRTPDLPLADDYHYSYRWPSSWAHVVHGATTLCGARSVLQDLSAAERRRLEQMPVCPACIDRYRVRVARGRAASGR